MDYNSQKAARSRRPPDTLVRLSANQNQRERRPRYCDIWGLLRDAPGAGEEAKGFRGMDSPYGVEREGG